MDHASFSALFPGWRRPFRFVEMSLPIWKALTTRSALHMRLVWNQTCCRIAARMGWVSNDFTDGASLRSAGADIDEYLK